MNWLIISDIHGSVETLKKALHYFQSEACGRLIILGDILYHGPRNPIPQGYNPQAVVALLNEMKEQIIAVRGNCEAEVDQMLLDFPCMADYSQLFDQDIPFFLTHGHIYSEQHLPSLPSGSVFMQGHTHLWTLKRQDQTVICNPGSITLSKENRPATFALYRDSNLSIRRLSDNEVLASLQIRE